MRLYLVEKKMGRSRRKFLTELAKSKGFIVEEELSDEVTHVISEEVEADSLWVWLKGRGLNKLTMMHVVDIGWFTESMKECRPVTVETRHLIQDPAVMKKMDCPGPTHVSQYACQRRTTTVNKNNRFTEVLEVLADSYEWTEMEGACLAFRRAASVLKSLPYEVEKVEATEGLPCLGDHTRTVIKEILQYGRSFEVEKILADERYQTLKLFTSVFGVGPKTAEKWYRKGLRTFKDILMDPSIHLNRMQQSGLLHYKDMSRPVSAAEARAMEELIDQTVRTITLDAVVTLTGGFRRGKQFGHDVDFIVTTPEQREENSLLPQIIERLEEQGLLLFSAYHPSTFAMEKIPCHRFEAMDYYAKCFLIVKLEGCRVQGCLQTEEGDRRDWRAVRVDLVAPSMDRFAYTLLGWTGSRQFERDLRRFARAERNMLLDNHGLYDKTKKQFLAALTEKDIFAHLGLEYMEPWQRNA